MLVFRSLVLGLIGACFLLLVSRPSYVVFVARESRAPAPAPAAATIVDVAPGVSGAQIPALLHLKPDERIVAFYDTPISSEQLAYSWIGANWDILNEYPCNHRSYVDLTVAGPDGERRVLVLIH
jgi:hypothetical protein